MTVKIEKGEFTSGKFPYLLRDLSGEGSTGMLSMKFRHIRKFLFLRDGNLVFAQSSLPEEQLAMCMYNGGVFEEDMLGRVQTLIRSGGWKNPEIESITDSKTISWWLKSLIREIILSIFEWTDGEYRFFHGQLAPPACIKVRIDTMKLLFACVRRVRNEDLLCAWLGGMDRIPKIDYSSLTNRTSDLNLTPQEGFFISRIDGIMSFRQILSMAGSQRLGMLQFFVGSILTDLISSGTQRPVFRAESTEPQTETVPRIDPSPKPETPEPVEPKKTPGSDTRRSLEDTDEIKLTAEELVGLSNYARTLREDIKEKEEKKVAEMGLLRGDEYVELGSEDEMSVDIDSLRKKMATTRSGKSGKNKVSVMIDGKEIDEDQDPFGRSFISDFLGTDDADSQWDRWNVIDVETDESKDDSTWRTWDDQNKEMESLKQVHDDLSDKMRLTHSEDLLDQLKERTVDVDDRIATLIEAKKHEVLNAHRRSQIQNHYEVLRVSRDCTENEIRTAFTHWSQEYQPQAQYFDDFLGLTTQLVELDTRLNQAYTVLSDQKRRSIYDSELEKQEEAAKAIQKKKKSLAEDHLMSARTALRRGDQMMAIRFLRGSLSLDSSNPRFLREMASILIQEKKWWPEALKLYHRAYHFDRDNLDLLTDVADLSMKMELFDFAIKAINEVLHKNPDHPRGKQLRRQFKKR